MILGQSKAETLAIQNNLFWFRKPQSLPFPVLFFSFVHLLIYIWNPLSVQGLSLVSNGGVSIFWGWKNEDVQNTFLPISLTDWNPPSLFKTSSVYLWYAKGTKCFIRMFEISI